MKDSLELKEDIMGCQGIIDDLRMLCWKLDDDGDQMDPIDVSNIIRGLEALYDIKYKKLWKTSPGLKLMCDLNKILVVVNKMFPDSVVSLGTKHQHSSTVTVLLEGKHEYNPAEHRRDMVDCMLFFNLYVKRLNNGLYESGSHDENINITKTDIKPTIAITEMAYELCNDSN